MTDRVAIVTGGGYGIGRASCVALAADGWRIVTVDRDGGRNAETAALVERAGGRARVVDGDVADAATAARACEIARELGALRALVAAAALRHPGSVVDISEPQWDDTIAACVKGVFVFAKAVVPELAAAGGGAIVTFSSPSALVHKNNAAYAAAKAAVETLTRCIAVDHLHQRIRANAIVPPFTVTGMTEQTSADRLSEQDARSPSGRAARPEDLAHLVRFLVSEESATLTGGVFGTTLPIWLR